MRAIRFNIFMKKFKSILRIAGLVVLILLAASGMGFGFFLSANRERYQDKKITTEQDKKENDEEQELKEIEKS